MHLFLSVPLAEQFGPVNRSRWWMQPQRHSSGTQSAGVGMKGRRKGVIYSRCYGQYGYIGMRNYGQILETPIGALPVRYLGVSLVDRHIHQRSPHSSDLRLTASIREGGDALGRLAGTPPLTRGPTGSTEVGSGRYTHLLYVDLQDAGRSQETSREDHAELLLARFPASGITGGSARGMDHRVPAGLSRRARHTKSLAY